MTVNLTDYWGVDRSPGGGKTIYATPGDATTEAPINPITGIGGDDPDIGVDNDETTWPPLLEPGEPLAPPGDPNRDRGLIAFRRAVGFDGSTYLDNLPTAANSSGVSLSMFVNFGVLTIPGFVPGPNYGIVYVSQTSGSDYGIYLYAGEQGGDAGGLTAIPQPSTNSPFVVNNETEITYPSDGTTSTGWVHFMQSMRFQGSTGFRVQMYINDTEICDFNQNGIGGVSFCYLNSDVDNYQRIGYKKHVSHAKMAVTEFVLYRRFIDWSVQANREKFHTSDSGWGVANTTYAPVDIGRTGRRPGFGRPHLYLTGGPGIFRRNRAGATTLTQVTTSSGLFAIDDPPG